MGQSWPSRDLTYHSNRQDFVFFRPPGDVLFTQQHVRATKLLVLTPQGRTGAGPPLPATGGSEGGAGSFKLPVHPDIT